jgi:hypothetical protein
MSKHGIFWLEGDWWGTPHKRTSVEPVFTLLSSAVSHAHGVPQDINRC